MSWLLTSRRLTILLALLILWGTLLRQGSPVPSLSLSDKAYHLIAFAVLVFPRTYRNPERWWRYAALATALGAGIEVIQPYFGRSREGGDLIADVIGVALGVLAALLLRWATSKRAA